jgi:protocatechuate 3,4-dioxygenase beta subunit
MTQEHQPDRVRNGMQPDGMYEGRPLANPDEPIFDQGLAFDVETLMDRRRVLKLIGYAGLSAGLFAIVGCGTSAASVSPSRAASSATVSGTAAATTTPTTAAAPTTATATATTAATAAAATATASAATAAASAASCDVIPEETAGPFPGDGSNGPDVLTLAGVVRSDIRKSIGTGSATAEGIPLTIKLAIQNAADGCAPLAGAAVYLWHCDREGRYSLYSQGVTGENYLRGVQEADAQGVVTFQSIFPACYSGRWPHIHFEVYPSLAKATDPANRIATSQIALPEDACTTVYATTGYSQSVSNLKQVSLARDNVFGDDGGVHELGTITGDVASGMTVTLNVPVDGA